MSVPVVAIVTSLVALAVAGSLAPAPAAAQAQGPNELGPAVEVPLTLRAAAPIDLTGTWVSVVSEDWRWRMMTPPRGDYSGVPLTAAGRRLADNWDPGDDEARGLACKTYGAAGIMRVPGRLDVSWVDDNTIRIAFDAGSQTRDLHFGNQPAGAERTWQGQSSAIWELPVSSLPRADGESGPDPPTGPGALVVETTNMRAGYLRKNGVPYGEDAALTEYFERVTAPNGDEWLIVTGIVDDPTYLTEPFVTSSHFKKEPDNSRFNPTPCIAPRP